MDRRSSRDRHRMRLGIGILASVACHAVLFALVTFDLDPIAGPETIRRTARAPASVAWNAWTERPLQVVRIRSTSHASNTESGAATERATPTAPVQASDVGASPVGAPVAAMPPAALDPGGAHGAPAIDVAFVASTPGGSLPLRTAIRGVIRRACAATGTPDASLEFTAASAAAREAERRRRGDGLLGPGAPIVGRGKGCPGGAGPPSGVGAGTPPSGGGPRTPRGG